MSRRAGNPAPLRRHADAVELKAHCSLGRIIASMLWSRTIARTREYAGSYGLASSFKDRYFSRQYRTSRNRARNPFVSISQLRRNPEPAGSSDPHSLDAIKETVYKRAAVDSDIVSQRFAIFVNHEIRGAARRLPPNRFTLRQPHSQAYPVIVLPADQVTGTGNVCKQFQSGSKSSARRFTPVGKDLLNVH